MGWGEGRAELGWGEGRREGKGEGRGKKGVERIKVPFSLCVV